MEKKETKKLNTKNKFFVIALNQRSLQGGKYAVFCGYKKFKDCYTSDLRYAHIFGVKEAESLKDKEHLLIPVTAMQSTPEYAAMLHCRLRNYTTISLDNVKKLLDKQK